MCRLNARSNDGWTGTPKLSFAHNDTLRSAATVAAIDDNIWAKA